MVRSILGTAIRGGYPDCSSPVSAEVPKAVATPIAAPVVTHPIVAAPFDAGEDRPVQVAGINSDTGTDTTRNEEDTDALFREMGDQFG